MEERPIEGVGTAVAAFVGLAPEGPIDDPVGIDVDGWGTDEDAIWGALPYAVIMIAFTLLILAVPAIVTWLPGHM